VSISIVSRGYAVAWSPPFGHVPRHTYRSGEPTCADAIAVHGDAITVSASVGVAANTPGVAATGSLHRADLAMYEAKTARRLH
jgi:GGDEF domain-containing protein